LGWVDKGALGLGHTRGKASPRERVGRGEDNHKNQTGPLKGRSGVSTVAEAKVKKW